MHFQLLTLYPEMFPGMLGQSLAGRALDKGIWSYEAINIRDYAKDKHKTVDDTPYGGGAGMVMRADILGAAIENNVKSGSKLIYMSPRGKTLTQSTTYELAKCKNISIICGRFEGIDERVLEEYGVEEVSIGDYILSGGEVAATVLMDSCIRLLPGVVGNSGTHKEESFGQSTDYAGLLEYPLYTRPEKWNGRDAPNVLLSGNHGNIAKWRLEKAEELTKQKRPDLFKRYLAKKYDSDK
jgi:tRNA (guanine37-N1)-methyltransferase